MERWYLPTNPHGFTTEKKNMTFQINIFQTVLIDYIIMGSYHFHISLRYLFDVAWNQLNITHYTLNEYLVISFCNFFRNIRLRLVKLAENMNAYIEGWKDILAGLMRLAGRELGALMYCKPGH
jgi:hypothetical protein